MAPQVLKERAIVTGKCRETALVAKKPLSFLGRGCVVCDTCAIATWVREPGINTLMADSAETAYYASTMNNVDVVIAPLNQCLREACR